MSNRTLQALRAQRDAAAAEIRNMMDLGPTEFTAELKMKCDAKLDEVDGIDAQIATIRRALDAVDPIEALGREHAARTGLSADHATAVLAAKRKAFVNALRYGHDGLSDEDRQLVNAGKATDLARINNIAIGTGSAGGVLVPTELQATLLQAVKAFGGVRAVADSITTAGGNPMAWPTNDDTAAEGEMLGEGVTATDDDMTFGSVSANAYKFSSKAIPISIEALQDSAIDVEALVFNNLATRIARGQNRKFTTGSGTNEPMGVVTGASVGVTMAAGNTTSVTADALVDLLHSLDPGYRDGASYMMHDQTFQSVRKLKDGNGRPLYLPSTESATGGKGPDQLNGKPLVINQHMATMAANARSVLCGNFKKYLIRDAMGVLILRFDDSAYAKKGTVGFLGFARADGRIIDASNASIKALVNSAT